MFTCKNVFIFLAGAVFFHALSHFLLPYYITLPMQFGPMTLTPQLNVLIAWVSLALTVGLLFAAKRCK